MGGASKSSSSSSSSSHQQPWQPWQPYLKEVMGQAQGLYEQGSPAYYPGATYASFNPVQEQAFDRTIARSYGSPTEHSAHNFIQNRLSQPMSNLGQYDAFRAAGAGNRWLQQDFTSQLRPLQGYVGRHTGQDPTFRNILGDIKVQTRGDTELDPRATDPLASMARGDYLNSNPYLDRQYNRAAENVSDQFRRDVLPGVNATFGSAGRTGSHAHTASLGRAQEAHGDTLSDLATNIYGGNYAQERQNQLDAAKSLGSLGLGRGGLGIQAANLGANIYGTDVQRQIAAGNLGKGLFDSVSRDSLGRAGIYSNERLGLDSLRSQERIAGEQLRNQQQLAALGMVPQMNQLDWNNINQMQGVGDRIYDQSEKVLQDDINRFNYAQQSPWDNLNRFANIILAPMLNEQISSSRGKNKSTSVSINPFG